ncbi:hypothetical protein GCM10025880_64500 [Methylorubrum aminovorans]|nr:hypothetical protein GCM10025880_64500 [Methylorubrum aminovorans]
MSVWRRRSPSRASSASPVSVAQDLYDAFLATAGITVISISDAIARRAVQAFEIYGKDGGGYRRGKRTRLRG